jgi:adenosylcobinamide-phosphate synthase
MSLELQILLAFGLDLVLGDPRWFPHPVRLIGALALALERPSRKFIPQMRLAGVVAAAAVLLTTALATESLLLVCALVHPVAYDLLSVLLLYTGIAARDMAEHSQAVWMALLDGSLAEARRKVGLICGRDTGELEQQEVIRAAVESVAENTVDGVVAPLFFAIIGGPVGIMLYKAINTLDSSFGYMEDRYREFGWASARIDDLANFIPSRITGLLIVVASAVLSLRAKSALRIFLRDRKKHPSPNAGHAEAAMAGALGVQLGGASHYSGVPSAKPTLGDPVLPLELGHILQANRLLLVTSGLALLLFLAARLLTVSRILV